VRRFRPDAAVVPPASSHGAPSIPKLSGAVFARERRGVAQGTRSRLPLQSAIRACIDPTKMSRMIGTKCGSECEQGRRRRVQGEAHVISLCWRSVSLRYHSLKRQTSKVQVLRPDAPRLSTRELGRILLVPSRFADENIFAIVTEPEIKLSLAATIIGAIFPLDALPRLDR